MAAAKEAERQTLANRAIEHERALAQAHAERQAQIAADEARLAVARRNAFEARALAQSRAVEHEGQEREWEAQRPAREEAARIAAEEQAAREAAQEKAAREAAEKATALEKAREAPSGKEDDKEVASPESSADNNRADGIAAFIAYDTVCEKMPIAFQRLTETVLLSNMLSTAALEVATKRVTAFYQKVGPAHFCKLYKPVVENAMASYRNLAD